MFGFGKKKQKDLQQQNEATANLIAGVSIQIIWAVKEEYFQDFSDRLKRDYGSTYDDAGTACFFLEATPYDADFMAYGLGFIRGMIQAYGKDESCNGLALVQFISGYEKTLSIFVDALGLKHNPKSYSELFMEALDNDVLTDSENGSEGLGLGLIDGKGFGDYFISVENDFLALKNTRLTEDANLDGLRYLLKHWSIGCLLNKDLLNAFR